MKKHLLSSVFGSFAMILTLFFTALPICGKIYFHLEHEYNATVLVPPPEHLLFSLNQTYNETTLESLHRGELIEISICNYHTSTSDISFSGLDNPIIPGENYSYQIHDPGMHYDTYFDRRFSISLINEDGFAEGKVTVTVIRGYGHYESSWFGFLFLLFISIFCLFTVVPFLLGMTGTAFLMERTLRRRKERLSRYAIKDGFIELVKARPISFVTLIIILITILLLWGVSYVDSFPYANRVIPIFPVTADFPTKLIHFVAQANYYVLVSHSGYLLIATALVLIIASIIFIVEPRDPLGWLKEIIGDSRNKTVLHPKTEKMDGEEQKNEK